MKTFVYTSKYGPRGWYRVAAYVKSRNGGASQFRSLSNFLTFNDANELAAIYASFPANHTTRPDCSCEACTFDVEGFTAAIECRAPFIERPLTCAKCGKVTDHATYRLYHGCCSDEHDKDEGVCVMVGLPTRASKER